ncbi:MAG: phosphoribosylaminoimidazolesuccinocarboxamide synthase [Lentisphaeria bacterium]|nr:phosphoribosylaminoimidazolesuccinocarboxamide synthase [Lentisphaeria bacterium]
MQYDANGALLNSAIPELGEPVRGKVRDIYDLGDSLLLVTSDRLSAFDVILPNGIPDKGKVLNAMAKFWFEYFADVENHLISMDSKDYPAVLQPYAEHLEGRSMWVKKCSPYPVECVARGYLIGSGWKEYQASKSVCGISLRDGYEMAAKLDEVIFTPATKAEVGDHDENISFERMAEIVGQELADELKANTISIYSNAAEYARGKGIIIADTKFEFGELDGKTILIDEVLTCDSSRFWPIESWQEGFNPPSLDKQYVRDYLESLDWDKTAPGPELPEKVVANTRKIYMEAYKQLTGKCLFEKEEA